MAAKKRGKAKARSAQRVTLGKARSPIKAKGTKKKTTARKVGSASAAKASAPRRSAKVAASKDVTPRKKKPSAPRATKLIKAAPPGKMAAKPTSAAKGLAVGDMAPAFELTDHLGQQLSSADLTGRPYVLYFYPKDDTPGCTVEACGFRDSAGAFDGIGVRVIGVSPDSVASHQRFIAKYGLPFSLLSDGKQSLANAYGVWSLKKNYGREYMGVVRSTFLVDAAGVIRNSWRGVKVKGHVDAVQAAARALN